MGVTSTLTCPAMGDLLMMDGLDAGRLFTELNRDVQWCDPLAVGFVTIRLDHEAATARFMRVTHPRAKVSDVVVAKQVRSKLTRSGVGPWRSL